VVPLTGQRVRQAPEGTVAWQECGEWDIAVGEYCDRTVRHGGQDGPDCVVALGRIMSGVLSSIDHDDSD